MNTYQTAFDAICDTPAESLNMRLRAELMRHIAQTIQANQWTQKQAAAHCGITQPRINDLLSGKIHKFSLDALVNINAQMGQGISLQFDTAFA
ncbi:helix-turn-helix transcriptional regulator [Kingella kingae]|uniref:helix-turn-helix domain-containing protein n=1 Tax=Kingella kingae TaxID=504 RepID=UPI0002585A69|nr:helix-turn-helix transcriptional regulator [Kingella kingae]EIC13254.1 putative phage associated protein [Kingella kingae PYKK081]MBD3614788.1 XRE family transcriptional regulator [Kingella kingae]MBD3633135.1 XRE family transcriptional regulator [Kingella kingae]MBD3660455.1 XRE family transcriptional regulator [Kingella kingae]MDK4564175.1 helix-turn-helix transcriptional regulator [Kingella kingae]